MRSTKIGTIDYSFFFILLDASIIISGRIQFLLLYTFGAVAEFKCADCVFAIGWSAGDGFVVSFACELVGSHVFLAD